MREIKFRAWDKERKIMLSWEQHITMWCLHKDEHLEIMQYTGLKDKNGKEIYEGDIVILKSIDISGSRTTEVIFRNGSFREKYMGYALDCYKDYEIEIIGNIYENPELLT